MINYLISYYFVFVNLLFIAAFALVVLESLKAHKKNKIRKAELNSMKERYRKVDMETLNFRNDAIKFLHLKNS